VGGEVNGFPESYQTNSSNLIMTGGWAVYNNEYQLFDVLHKITSEYSIIA
jgi:hypothetical protein